MTFIKGQTSWNRGFKILNTENYGHWKGNKVGYSGIHVWLRKHFGKANKCENPDCSKKCETFHWAKLRDKLYERKRENFWMLCQSCHAIYDEFKPAIKFPKGNIPWNKGKKGVQVFLKKKSIKRICQVCCKEFEVFLCIVKLNKGKYCSKFCFDKFQRRNHNS